MHDRQDLNWHDYNLCLGTPRDRVVATVEPDAQWPKMYRVRLSNGELTDMVNLTRAKDAAVALALGKLNRLPPPLPNGRPRMARKERRETAAEASPMRYFG